MDAQGSPPRYGDGHGASGSTTTPAGHDVQAARTSVRADTTFDFASAHARWSAGDTASPHNRAVARSIEPSARHAVVQLPAADASSREDLVRASLASDTDPAVDGFSNALVEGAGAAPASSGAGMTATTGGGAGAAVAAAAASGARASRASAAHPVATGAAMSAPTASHDLTSRPPRRRAATP
jgi:hypothetical protein